MVPGVLPKVISEPADIDSDGVIAVVGLGYVGLPLAIEFGKHRTVIGFDIDQRRIASLMNGVDLTLEVTPQEFMLAKWLSFTSEPSELRQADIFIVTVPSPIDAHKRPDLGPLLAASKTVGENIKRGGLVIYESTVYPGCTEDDCIPIIERFSGLKFNQDFFAGYSPERINPGDKLHRLPDIKKVTSGSTLEAAEAVDALYASIIRAGTYKAENIRVAEAAKVIENTQRDLNIALVNELAMIFNKLELDTEAVLAAAATKWNFVPFQPGLVGGHCIGVDPYYLMHKAEAAGYRPKLITAGRRVNDGMGAYIAGQVIKLMIGKGQTVRGARVLVMGMTFKENCPDLRNTRVVDVVEELRCYHACVDVMDPWVDAEEVASAYGINVVESPKRDTYAALVLAVAHQHFRELSI